MSGAEQAIDGQTDQERLSRMRSDCRRVHPAIVAENQRAIGAYHVQLGQAIAHLQAVLNKARTHAEQQAADTAARDWLASIGSEPN